MTIPEAEVTIPSGAVIYLYLGSDRVDITTCKKPGVYAVDTTYYDYATLNPIYYARHLPTRKLSCYGTLYDSWRVNVDGIPYRKTILP